LANPLKPTGQAQNPTRGKNPQWIYAGRKADNCSYCSNRSRINVVIGAPRKHERTGRNQSQRHGNQTGLNGDASARLLETIPGSRHEKRQNAGRPAHRRRRYGRTDQATNVISDQRHDDDVRSPLIAIAAFMGVAIMQWPLPLVFAVLAPVSVACAWMTR
jgi:hypothetical protein